MDDEPHARALWVLAAGSLAIDAVPRVPWEAGLLAAVCFAGAAAVRTTQARHDAAVARREFDRLIATSPRRGVASPLVRRRAAELTARRTRERLRRLVESTLQDVDPRQLPSASPLHRPAARANADLLQALALRLGDARPVAARGVVLTHTLLTDPTSPLYSDDADLRLTSDLRRVLAALEP